MKFGVAMFPTDYAISAPELAQAMEERGFESVFFPEHTHIPASRKTPMPSGEKIPPEYYHTLDPFVALTAAAMVTSKLRLATGICLVVERDPITLAKEVASVDHISGGRLLFGIGGGWNREEMENHGTDYATRWTLMKERVEAMKQIWGQEEAEYHGQYVNFDPIWSWPKPVQKPHPPIIVGGDGPRTLQRVVKYGDEWMPIFRGNPAPFPEKIQRLQAMAAEAGRGEIPVSLFFAPDDAQVLAPMQEMGFSRLIFRMPSVARDEALARLDVLSRVMEQMK